MKRVLIQVLTSFCVVACMSFACLLSGCDDPHNAEGTLKVSPNARNNINSFGKPEEGKTPSPYGPKGKLLGGAKPGAPK